MKVSELIKVISAGKLDERLKGIYVDSELIEYQRNRYVGLLQDYLDTFEDNDVMIISVPGRSEIAGNHTDHQHGCVMACAINLDMIAVVSKADKTTIFSNGTPIIGIDVNDLEYKKEEEHTSKALVKGVMYKLKENGYKVGNFQTMMISDVLVGSGMSSSAAFEVMIAEIINELFNDGKISKIEMAIVSQFSENQYFGKSSGLMDQMACSVGDICYIDFKDVDNPVVEKLDVNFAEFEHSLCIVDTTGSHAKLTNEYSAIPQEMHKVADYFHKDYLREITIQDIMENLPQLRKWAGDRAVLRAIHMLLEDERVEKQKKNLINKDFDAFKTLIKDSGDSSYKFLQNVYAQGNTYDQSVAVGLCISDYILQDKGVTRVHGGGFAGTIQAFVQDDYVKTYKEEMEKVFGNGACYTLKIDPFGAVKVID